MAEYTLFPSLTPTDEDEHTSIELAFENDTCPWCGDSYANVKAHASQSHPDEWAEWKGED